ncbi:sensor histidine kinase [Aeromicrobium ginsengisoli]|uniref:histidine kinase n=1 Tax=Aeromicrobium ginsengisoli TaxID=363867 RepID=A0A5M4FK47_9ACTN|nr:sensor histidine kinase [Aeromicrobium ginsengisoli]KAA1400133.1 sensor histidine kinase [Aeromicrobium ginsengisoli]
MSVDLRAVPRTALFGWLPLAVFQVVGTVGANHNQTGHRRLDALAIVIAVLGPVSLLFLRRWPRQVLAFVVAITVAYVLRDYAFGPVLASLAIATVLTVVRGHRVAAWLGLGTVVVTVLAIQRPMYDREWSWSWLSGALAWSLLVLAVGELVRVRRERIIASRQARAEASRRQANEERLQIARELHDVVAHHISLINVQAGVALHIVDRKPEQAQTALEAIKDASKDALVELRSLVGILRDVDDEAPRRPSGTLASLDDLVERSGHAGLEVRKTVRGDVRPLPSSVELAALRIVQEAITNVVRHAGASAADIELAYGTDSLSVTVIDNGAGFSWGAAEGTGIIGMRERAETLGGSLDVGQGPVGGTRVLASLPLRSRS